MASTSGELIGTMLSLMPDAAVVVDDRGLMSHVNDALSALFGYEADELIGQRIEVLVPERFRSAHVADRSGYIGDPGARAMGAGLALFGRRRDGTEFPVDISLAPLTLSGETAIVAAVRDVSDRIEAEQVRARLAAIVEASGDAILAIAVDCTVQSWNPGAQRTLGHAADEVVGSHVSVLVPADSSLDFEEQLAIAMRGENQGSRDSEWLTKDNRRLPVAVLVSPLRSGGQELTGFSVVVRDIAQRKQAEADLRRLLAEGERNARWQAIMAEIRLRLLDDVDLGSVLELVSERLCELLDAKGAAVVLGEPPRIMAATGVAVALRDDASVTLPPVGHDAPEIRRVEALDPEIARVFDGRDVLLVPIGPATDASGYLMCAPSDDPDPTAITVALSLADQAALALELDRAKAAHELLLIGDERERIARDLHDLVIQRLFASGLGLQSIVSLVSDERAAKRLADVVDELDTTIREIRTTIFTLAPSPLASSGLRAEVLEVAKESSRALGFEPTVHFDGAIDNAVSRSDVSHVLAVVREALSNVARHAHAQSASVDISSTADHITVVVTDDGVGLPADIRESGMKNLRSRAEDLGGTFEVQSGDAGGVVLRWQVPISR